MYVIAIASSDFSCYSYFSSSCSKGPEMSQAGHILNLNNINPNVLTMEYAVRGPLVIRAAELEKEIASGVQKPFKRVIRANIGDCHAMGQKALTYFRQVLACAFNPTLMGKGLFPSDVEANVKDVLAACGGKSVGSYTDSVGIELIRKYVAKYIQDRDGFPAQISDIFLCGGASEAVRDILNRANTCETEGAPVG